ncbi:MAG TPA: MFS transporter [Gammaproteobacteria bacterium]|jgi:MFS family permease|uniref:MFS transporter n=4 Tax=OM182 clade TaxID=745002 RepID=A0A0R2SEI2_9GAMM|nr:MAG: MFS transporter [OM182 bacterium BACL3 MAG-120507-bin80]KRO82797.1 MAG: MFS transporter [OM182 bacterium BACL3 MAG-120619-bin3]KRO84851.1 MAG: MFS transporter [OM182 bacterium BACL3 MAG-120920-bin41]KRP29599.1 MAG: MFS transporter [OM182 bacterium BACL3 MAG-120924-bin41]MBT5906379.1 MHS family MFS transporter [Gammaproteobacteria bacterium]
MAQADQTHLKMSMRKVALTALAGTSIEWYDFFLYATAAALVFPSAFFPGSDPTIGLVLSFGTFAFGFIARPLGGIIFGHFGDRVGRKKTLVIALWMMGISSTLIGLLPTYATIGVAAPIILCLLRFAQGLAIGGQWGGAMLLVTESAPADKRGYYGAYAQAGAPVGVILANIAFILISSSISEEAFMDWGWRVPFISSVLLIGISMYVQLHMEDTAAFKELQAIKEKRDAQSPVKIVRRSPIIEALIKYPKRIALAAGAFLSIQVAFYILIGFVLAYGGDANGAAIPRDTMLFAVLIASAIQVPTQFWAASYSDRHGRRGIFMLGAVLTGVWAFALFPLIDTGEFWLVVLGISGGLAFLGLMYGPQAAFFTELFSTEVRYSGASLGYQIGAIVGGAFAPTIATILWIEYDIVWVSVYIAGASLLSLIAVKMLTETYQSSLSDVD